MQNNNEGTYVFDLPAIKKLELKDWTIPDSEGNISVPDELDSLVNRIATQLRFHTISGKSEVETVVDITFIAQTFFLSEHADLALAIIAHSEGKLSLEYLKEMAKTALDKLK